MTEGTKNGLQSQIARLTAQRDGVAKKIKATDSAIARVLKPKVEPLDIQAVTKHWAEKVQAGVRADSWLSVVGTDTHALRKQRVTLGALSASLSNRIRKIRKLIANAS